MGCDSHEAGIQQLMQQFDRMLMDENEMITIFAPRLIVLTREIMSLGEKLPERAVVKCLFTAVPDRFSQIIRTIE